MLSTDFDGVVGVSPSWEDIPLLSNKARAMAGPNGPMNAQAIKLTQRTEQLKNDIDALRNEIITPVRDSNNLDYDGGTVAEALDTSKSLQNYAALRAYKGRATAVRITSSSIAGVFRRTEANSLTDDGGTTIIDAVSRAWTRDFTGDVNILWFGDSLDGSMDNAPSLSKAVDAALARGVRFIDVPGPTLLISSEVDLQGVGIKGQQTTIPATANARNVGPLKNCIVRGFSTDTQVTGTVTPTNPASYKIVERASAGSIHLFTRSANGRLLQIEHIYNSYGSAPTDTGSTCQNWRFTQAWALSGLYLYKHSPTSQVGAWTGPTNTSITASFPDTPTGRPLKYLTTTELNAELSWAVTAKRVGEKSNVAIYSTAGSASAVEVRVNGTLVRTFNAVLVTGYPILIVDFELNQVGPNTITVRKTGGGTLNVFGVNLLTLDDFKGQEVDTFAYGVTNQQYTKGNGANDYAFFSTSQNKWFGSFHGGETERAAPLITIDGASAVFPANVGDFSTGKVISLIQSTKIQVGTDYMDVDSRYVYASDGHALFEVSMKGDCIVTNAYTCMSITAPEFTSVLWPVRTASLTPKTLMGRCDTVTQLRMTNPNNRLTLTTKTTLFPMGGETGANMAANGPYISALPAYSKLYYGPVVDSPTRLLSLAYSTERLFG